MTGRWEDASRAGRDAVPADRGSGRSRAYRRGSKDESRFASARALAGSRIRVAVLWGAPFFSRSATPQDFGFASGVRNGFSRTASTSRVATPVWKPIPRMPPGAGRLHAENPVHALPVQGVVRRGRCLGGRPHANRDEDLVGLSFQPRSVEDLDSVPHEGPESVELVQVDAFDAETDVVT